MKQWKTCMKMHICNASQTKNCSPNDAFAAEYYSATALWVNCVCTHAFDGWIWNSVCAHYGNCFFSCVVLFVCSVLFFGEILEARVFGINTMFRLKMFILNFLKGFLVHSNCFHCHSWILFRVLKDYNAP